MLFLEVKGILGIYVGLIIIICDFVLSYDVNVIILIYVWIFYVVDYSFWLIKNKKGCQISSVVGDNDYCKVCLYYVQYLSIEIMWSI